MMSFASDGKCPKVRRWWPAACAATSVEKWQRERPKLPQMVERMRRMPELAQRPRHRKTVVNAASLRLERVPSVSPSRMLDENEFLSSCGI
jgi:hypothetical protein